MKIGTLGSIIGAVGLCEFLNWKVHMQNNVLLEKRYLYMEIMEQWINLLEQGKTIGEYLKSQGHHNIAIYGMGNLGEHLYRDLKKSQCRICCFDKNGIISSDFSDADLEEIKKCVDLVIVTPAYEYASIRENLSGQGWHNIVAIQEVINKCSKKLE